MNAPLLQPGDTVGFISPCNRADRDRFRPFLAGVEGLGYRVREGRNLYRSTYGFAASEQERIEDLADMLLDDDIRMILFGGGCVGHDLLPLLPYELLRTRPKLICSYSNGTSLLNAIHARTGLTTYYGQFPRVFSGISDYDREQFHAHFVHGRSAGLEPSGPRRTLRGGIGGGLLIGGFTEAMCLLIGSPYFSLQRDESYLLFLENHEHFFDPGAVATHLSYIEQTAVMGQVTGLLFGHYSKNESPELYESLIRFGNRHKIPVLYCDDFGHGSFHGLLPIGARCILDADAQSLAFVAYRGDN